MNQAGVTSSFAEYCNHIKPQKCTKITQSLCSYQTFRQDAFLPAAAASHSNSLLFHRRKWQHCRTQCSSPQIPQFHNSTIFPHLCVNIQSAGPLGSVISWLHQSVAQSQLIGTQHLSSASCRLTNEAPAASSHRKH